MARPRKDGLDYFPLVTNFDMSVRIVLTKWRSDGLSVFIAVLQEMYRRGSSEILVSAPTGVSGPGAGAVLAESAFVSPEKFMGIIRDFADNGVFDIARLLNDGILHSHGVQKQLEFYAEEREAARIRAAKNRKTKPKKSSTPNVRERSEL